MATRRPKPSWPDSKSRDANAPFLGWLDRLLGDLLGSYATLAEAIQAMIDSSAGVPAAHATSHVEGGSDEIDGDAIESSFSPSNYTPSDTNIGGQLDGIDDELGALDTRIGAIEAAEASFKTTPYSGYGWAGGTNLPLGGGPRYFGPIGQNPGVGSATLIQREMKFGRSGTLTNFRYQQLLSSGNANTMTVALAINGANTALIFTGLAGTNTTEQGPDTSEVSITAGDLLVLSAEADGAAGAATSHGTWSFDFVES